MAKQDIDGLIAEMTLAEKIGQLCQVQPQGRDQEQRVRDGMVGSLINVVGDDAYFYQSQAVDHSRLKIPLLIGRDVIHGFSTIFPIPLGQAASFDPDAVSAAAAIAAREAGIAGVNWTFSPMVDVGRDPRWGRVAEGFGEDPYLAGLLGRAMIEGYQGEKIAACAKHFVGYGAAEGGRDYSETAIPRRQLEDVYLRPFKQAVEAGVMSVMSAFNDLDGIPCTGNAGLIDGLLKRQWGFDGLVVSDWNSVIEMIPHGFAADERAAARLALSAGIDMEMASGSFLDHIEALIEAGEMDIAPVDAAVRRVLEIKRRLGLFEQPYGPYREAVSSGEALFHARTLARKSCVLLKNEATLPLGEGMRRLAVIGPLADAAGDQLGCWVFDADHNRTRTVLAGLRERLGDACIAFEPGLPDCRSLDDAGFEAAMAAAREADAVVLCLGEDAGLSGEAHSRAHLGLPGAQQRLLEAVTGTGVPVVAVVMAGRPLVLGPVVEKAGAVLLAWHPGSMGGVAIANILFGEEPGGRLPMSLPRSVGQVPIYYNHKNTGRPPNPDAPSIPSGTPLDPVGFVAAYLDEDHRPLFPFGFGLGYTEFVYSDIALSTEAMERDGSLQASVLLTNVGGKTGQELVQMYVRDLVGSVTRPVRELKAFRQVLLAPGESRRVEFTLEAKDLGFCDIHFRQSVEPGGFRLWIGPNAAEGQSAVFEVV